MRTETETPTTDPGPYTPCTSYISLTGITVTEKVERSGRVAPHFLEEG